MRKKLRRSAAVMGLMGVVAASALAAGVATSGTADAFECTFWYEEVELWGGESFTLGHYDCYGGRNGKVSGTFLA